MDIALTMMAGEACSSWASIRRTVESAFLRFPGTMALQYNSGCCAQESQAVRLFLEIKRILVVVAFVVIIVELAGHWLF